MVQFERHRNVADPMLRCGRASRLAQRSWPPTRELEFAGAQVLVMPGPYERADRVAAPLEQLRGLLAE